MASLQDSEEILNGQIMPKQKNFEGRRDEDGVVIWITGLSGAGKSVIARRTYEILKSRLPNVVLIDGDHFRSLMADDLGHSPADRLENAYRIARFSNLLSRQGIHVVCATMSLFHECQSWNRQNIGRYFEVYIRVPLEVLIRRDPKGIYARALGGKERGVVGVDLPFEEPQNPDLIIENSAQESDFTPFARLILRRIKILTGLGGTIDIL